MNDVFSWRIYVRGKILEKAWLTAWCEQGPNMTYLIAWPRSQDEELQAWSSYTNMFSAHVCAETGAVVCFGAVGEHVPPPWPAHEGPCA